MKIYPVGWRGSGSASKRALHGLKATAFGSRSYLSRRLVRVSWGRQRAKGTGACMGRATASEGCAWPKRDWSPGGKSLGQGQCRACMLVPWVLWILSCEPQRWHVSTPSRSLQFGVKRRLSSGGATPSAIAAASLESRLGVLVRLVPFVTACSLLFVFIRCEIQRLVLITPGG